MKMRLSVPGSSLTIYNQRKNFLLCLQNEEKNTEMSNQVLKTV